MNLKFNFQKISSLPKDFFQKRKDLTIYLEKLREILKTKNYNFPESFLNLPEEKLKIFSKKNKQKILVVGMGGASLGAQAIYQALKNKKNLNEIFFFNSLNPLFLKKISQEISQDEKIIICFISESGKTLETIVNFFVLQKILKKSQLEVFIITKKKSALANFALKNNWQISFIPKTIVGRYSVFSNFGFLPLKLAGIDTKELFLGARKANQICLLDDPLKNPALISALTIFYFWKKGRNIYVNFVFPPDLEFFGKWYCQLMAESLAKDKKGITPMVSVGTTDFHSLAQLYLDGPGDKLINFIFVKNLDFDFSISEFKNFKKTFPDLRKKKVWQINSFIFQAMKKVFLKKKIPFTEIILPTLAERSLGELLEMKMIEIILLAKLMKVEAFNQPAVELYKKESLRILKEI